MKAKKILILFIVACFTFSCTVKGIICEDNVKIYSKKDINSEVIGQIIIGDCVDIIGVSNKPEKVDDFEDYFYLVNYYNKKGWVFGRTVISVKNKTKIKNEKKPGYLTFPYVLSEDVMPKKIRKKIEIIQRKDEKSYDIRLHYYSGSGDETIYFLPNTLNKIEKSDWIIKFVSSLLADFKKYPDIKDQSGNIITTWIDNKNKKSIYQKMYYKYDQQGKLVTAFWLTTDYRQNTEFYYENGILTESREFSHYRKDNFEEKPSFRFNYNYKDKKMIRMDCHKENNYMIWYEIYNYGNNAINMVQYRAGDGKIIKAENYKIIRDNIIEDIKNRYYYNDKGLLEKIEEKDRTTEFKYKFYR